MKRTFFLLLVSGIATLTNAQDTLPVKGTVEVVAGYPVFIYAVPAAEYTETGKISSFTDLVRTGVSEAGLREKIGILVKAAEKKVDKKKIPPFDAILLDPDNGKNKAIKFKGEVSRDARLVPVEDVPVFLFSTPLEKYTVVDTLPPKFPLRSRNWLLHDKVVYLIDKAKDKVDDKEIDPFDAMILDPEDISAILIKFE